MIKFKAYHKIKQFRDVVRAVNMKSDYKGKDAQGNPIYEVSKRPILTFTGTIKLHGTNAGICYSSDKGVLAQKRSSLLPVENLNSHMGFNAFVNESRNKQYFENLLKYLHKTYCTNEEQLTLYGEWAGKGIQKGVAISELPKAFYVFGLKIYNNISEKSSWIDIKDIEFKHVQVFNIYDFQTFKITIDFNNPADIQNKLIEITNAVENECPVAKKLGKSGIGEGVVWTSFWQEEKYIFKVKGDKHSVSKVKKLASVDVEKLKSIKEFVDYACTDNRMQQAIQETDAKERKHTPDVLRWLANDIISEESDTLKSNGLAWEDVAKECNNKARNYFFKEIDKILKI